MWLQIVLIAVLLIALCFVAGTHAMAGASGEAGTERERERKSGIERPKMYDVQVNLWN